MAVSGEVASGPVITGNLSELGLHIAANVLGEGAPGTEVAAGRWIGGAWKGALQDDALSLPFERRIRNRDRRQERLSVGMPRVLVQLGARCQFHELAEVHDSD